MVNKKKNNARNKQTFNSVNAKVDFPGMEKELLSWWTKNSIMKKYLSANQNATKNWSFIDGPITANNPMGVHHAWGRSYKDLYQRYKTMQGFKQRYQNGFDGQGLWVEVEVEKEMGFNSKRDIEEFGIDRFVEACKKRVQHYADIITEQSIRLGYWMNWEDSYHTMSDQNNYTIWHFLKKCNEKGWLYEGTDVMPWCPRCGTGLSEHEIATEGYKEIIHSSVFVKFPLVGKSNEYILIWTTTPWTLTSNVAAAVNTKLKYSKVSHNGEVFYICKTLIGIFGDEVEVIEEIDGEQLVGIEYVGPFDELTAQQNIKHTVIPWDMVSGDEGTGIVHIAPGCGKEDFALSKEFNLPAIAPLDEFGNYVNGFDWLEGSNVTDVNDAIFKSLENKGYLLKIQKYSHRYPVCWRCDSELVFRLVDEWFISMKELRHLIADVTKKINWIPSFGLERELDWLKNMDDWMISKKRYWGLALPIYKCECGHVDVIGGKDDLESRAVEGWSDFVEHSPHKPWIDYVKIKCTACNSIVERVKDVGNPWLDAGIVPYSTLKYLSDKEYWNEWFPAEWISESFPGQFRNWFYSLLTMSTVLENHEPFRSVFSYALMRDEKGEEMHKSKGNSIEFIEAANNMGVDAMRWVFARHNPAQNLSFGYTAVEEVRRHFLLTLWNIYSFFTTYAIIDNFDPSEISEMDYGSNSTMDNWIISELNSLVSNVTKSLDEYDSTTAARNLEEFVELLSNWYVRRNRRRFWKSENDEDKISAHSTLYICLLTVTKLIAPITPFISEEIYQNLVRNLDLEAPESVHLSPFPVADTNKINSRLDTATRLAMKISSIGRSARSKAGIRVRQPLHSVLVKTPNESETDDLNIVKDQIIEELNVKDVLKLDNELMVLDFDIDINKAVLGPKYGSEMSTISNALKLLDSNEIAMKAKNGESFDVAGYTLHQEDISINIVDKQNFTSISENGYTITINTEMSAQLIGEGIAREIVHKIQGMRKSAGFQIEDQISIYYESDDVISNVISEFSSYIQQETLATSLLAAKPTDKSYTERQKVNDFDLLIGITRK